MTQETYVITTDCYVTSDVTRAVVCVRLNVITLEREFSAVGCDLAVLRQRKNKLPRNRHLDVGRNFGGDVIHATYCYSVALTRYIFTLLL